MKKPTIFVLSISLIALFLVSACNSSKLVGVDDDPDAIQYDKTRMIVLLADKASPEKLVASFEKYGLEKVGPASRTFNEWLFTWTAKINPDVLIEDIRSSPIVKKAEFPEKFQNNN